MNNLNEILENGDEDAVLQSLQNPALQLKNVESSNILQYIRLLKKKKSEKEEQVESSTLWIDEIQQCVDLANHQTRVALKRLLLSRAAFSRLFIDFSTCRSFRCCCCQYVFR